VSESQTAPPRPAQARTVRGSERMARVYAEALLNAAEGKGVEAEVVAELEAIRSHLPAHPAFGAAIASQVMSRHQKDEFLTRIFEGRVEPIVLNFLRVLNRRNRLFLWRLIIDEVLILRDERADRIRVTVTSAVPLDVAQQDRLRDQLRASTGKDPVLDLRIDPALIGGLVVQVNGDVYDGSVRTRLETIRTQLLSRGSYEVQRGRDRFSS
jgi:F-type H+-transporting ATPase subunit delta